MATLETQYKNYCDDCIGKRLHLSFEEWKAQLAESIQKALPIEEDYVSFETAKLLKKKGFDEDCREVYYSDKEFDSLNYFEGDGSGNTKNSTIQDDYFWDIPESTAPIQALVLKWLRIKHGLHIFTDFGIGWGYGIVPVGYEGEEILPEFSDNLYAKTSEEATEAAIKYCLENLIK